MGTIGETVFVGDDAGNVVLVLDTSLLDDTVKPSVDTLADVPSEETVLDEDGITASSVDELKLGDDETVGVDDVDEDVVVVEGEEGPPIGFE